MRQATKGDIPVSVDRDFARFGNKSYAINKINSVEVRSRHPHGTAGMVICAMIAIGCVLGALGGAGGQAFVLGVIFGGLSVWLWRRSQIVEYQLFLMTSSSEAQAITSFDDGMIQRLRDRIEQAMAGQLTA